MTDSSLKLQPVGIFAYVTVAVNFCICAGLVVLMLAKPAPVAIIIAIAIAALGILPILFLAAMRNARLTVSDDFVKVETPIYKGVFALSEIEPESVRVATINANDELAPKWRTNGIGMPGLGLGWHRLRSGAKAYLATSGRTVLTFRMRDGLVALVGLENNADGQAAIARRLAR